MCVTVALCRRCPYRALALTEPLLDAAETRSASTPTC
jgi:hypothetical protein